MVKILAGGKKHIKWASTAISEYEKRLKKPFDVYWEVVDEEKLAAKLEKWPFSGRDFVILLDERGENLTSPEIAAKLQGAFNNSRTPVFIVGGAYGVSSEVRAKADLVLSFGKAVFPHMLARVMLAEQIYRAQEITRGSDYHHG